MEKDFILCSCNNMEHQFTLLHDVEDNELYMIVHLSKVNLWNRMRNAIKYVFGYNSKYGDWDEFVFTFEDAKVFNDRLTKYINNGKTD